MLVPKDIHIKDFFSLAPDGEGVVTDAKEARDYSTSEAGAVIGYTYEVALPSRRFEKIKLTVNGAALPGGYEVVLPHNLRQMCQRSKKPRK